MDLWVWQIPPVPLPAYNLPGHALPKGGELAGCEKEILQDTEVLPLPKGGLRGISVPLQQMQGSTSSPNTSGHPPSWIADPVSSGAFPADHQQAVWQAGHWGFFPTLGLIAELVDCHQVAAGIHHG